MQNEATKRITSWGWALFWRMFTCKIRYWFSSLCRSPDLSCCLSFILRLVIPSCLSYFHHTTSCTLTLSFVISYICWACKTLRSLSCKQAASLSEQLICLLHWAAIFDICHIPGGSPCFGEGNVNRGKLNQSFLTKSLCFISLEGWESEDFPT